LRLKSFFHGSSQIRQFRECGPKTKECCSKPSISGRNTIPVRDFLDNWQTAGEYDVSQRRSWSPKGTNMFSLRDLILENQSHMGSSEILNRVDSLIDDLLNDSNLSSSSLAAILMAARESVRDGYHVALARRTWDASNDLKLRQCPGEHDVLKSC
jgi:hypothetical protein